MSQPTEEQQEQIANLVRFLLNRINKGKYEIPAETKDALEIELRSLTFNQNEEIEFPSIGPHLIELAIQNFNNFMPRFRERAQSSQLLQVLPNKALIPESSSQIDFLSLSASILDELQVIVRLAADATGFESAPHPIENRPHAVCAGILVKIAKFLEAVRTLRMYYDGEEVILALLGPIFESSINLKYLCRKNNISIFNDFIARGLSQERVLYDEMVATIDERGAGLFVEHRMKASAEHTCNLWDTEITNISAIEPNWGQLLRQKLAELEEEHIYLPSVGLPGHAIHGTSADLIMYHLKKDFDGYRPNFERKRLEPRWLISVARFVAIPCVEFLHTFYDENPEIEPLREHAFDLFQRVEDVERLYNKSIEFETPSDITVIKKDEAK